MTRSGTFKVVRFDSEWERWLVHYAELERYYGACGRCWGMGV